MKRKFDFLRDALGISKPLLRPSEEYPITDRELESVSETDLEDASHLYVERKSRELRE
jgi:hypothetical protein